MRAVLPLFFLVLGTLKAFAQPANDNCNGAISLGTIPAACPTTIFTNINATASTGSIPSCFNGGTTQRDVWFTFTTPADVRQATITVKGVANGPNAKRLLNPQIAVYRGTCTGLSQVACISAPNGSSEVRLDATSLTPNVTYYVRVNDYAASATPNAGDFNICVQQFIPAINMGDVPNSTACAGTLYDSGGPDDSYGILEDYAFTICPTEPHACIEINLEEFDIEPTLLGIFGDALTFYAGNNVNAPVLASVEGQDIGTNFRIQTSTPCITVRFQSDFLANFDGFKLTWQCSAAPCDNRSFTNPVEIGSLPFNQNASTCESASTTTNTPCASDGFLNGPEYVFAYNSSGGACISVKVTGAAAGTGVLVLDGLPDEPGTNCIARSTTGSINSANLLAADTYYIVVANASGCTPFNISVEETNCAISPALVNALCNPLNGCVRVDGLPTIFDFEDGFQDMQIVKDVNNGCWLGFGVEPNFYWFTVQAQADGRFGFILDSANPDTLSDLDFNVWGPFTQDQVCGTPQQVINFIRNNQPIRSSWSPTSGPTGLTDRHPTRGYAVTDRYDCGEDASDAGADGDDYVSTIRVKKDEVYVVLINDWEDLIGDDGVAIDWSPSDPAVLEQLPAEVVAGDTAVCLGESVQILIKSPVNSIRWLNDTTTLSCTTCPNPIAKPLKTTEYRALVNAVCYNDTISVKVQVYDLDAGPDLTVCRGEKFDLVVGEVFDSARYSWVVPANIELSCTNCPNPTITTPTAGTYPLIVTLTAPGCTVRDTVNITVRAETAPIFTIGDDLTICEGATVSLGGAATPGVSYSWTSRPAGFTDTIANPQVTPTQTTTYILRATNTTCPLASIDSVVVTVFPKPILKVASDTAVCQEQPILLGNTDVVEGVDYTWFGADFIDDKDNPNTLVYPTQSGLYILVATSGGGICESRDTVNVNITPIDIEIQLEDTVQVCRGVPLGAKLKIVPSGSPVIFASTDGLFRDTITTDSITLLPDRKTTYIATINSGGCTRFDTLTVIVDSLPANLAIMPGDTSICEGSLVLLTSEIYEPKDFPNIKFKWVPSNGQQTPDSLYNMVISADTTTRYYRITTSGVCVDSAYTDITVKPIPMITITPMDTSVCVGQPVRLRVTTEPSNLEKPKWEEPVLGLSCTTCLDPIANVQTRTSFTFTGEKDGCPASASVTINVLPAPSIQLNSQTTICLGDSVQLNLASTPGATYRWTSSTDPNFVSTNPRLVVRPSQTTTYRLQAENGGCSIPARDITITVVQPANVNINGDSTLCRGEVLALTAVGTAPAGVPQNYQWEVNGRTFPGANLSIGNVNQDTRVRLIYTYGNNCGTVVKEINVRVFPVPLLQLTTDRIICTGESIQLNTAFEPQLTYTWTSSSDPNFRSNDPLLIVAPTQTTTYRLVVQSSECGNKDESIPITVLPNPSVTIQGDSLICDDEQLVITATGNAPQGVTESFLWRIPRTGQTFNTSSISPSFTDSIEVELVYSYGGCISSIKNFKAKKQTCNVQIPNAFTPNGDNRNDFFNYISDGTVTLLEFKVFNRWGQLVYNNSNPAQGWDGRHNGRDAPSDVYVYIIVVRYLNGTEETKRGNVTLIR